MGKHSTGMTNGYKEASAMTNSVLGKSKEGKRSTHRDEKLQVPLTSTNPRTVKGD